MSQGDIFENVDYFESATLVGGEFVVTGVSYPLAVVLSQDCDLQQDFRYRLGERKGDADDKHLISVLVAPLYTAEQLRSGTHLEYVSKEKTTTINSSLWKHVKGNQNTRYHHLTIPKEFGVPDSVVDFKHYFSVSLLHLHERRESHRICQVDDLHREDLCQRFATFLSRIAVPDVNDLD